MIRVKLHDLVKHRELQIKERITLKQLAKDAGIHFNTLYRLYNEESDRVDFAVLEKLCEYFGCQIQDLLEYDRDYIRKGHRNKEAPGE